jgi:hypothetical protein
VGAVVEFPARQAVRFQSWADRHRDRYFDRRWLRSKRGNPYVNLDEFCIAVFRTPEGWLWSRTRSNKEGPRYSKQAFATALEARQAAWDDLCVALPEAFA